MTRGRRLWYGLVGVGASAWLLLGLAVWFGWVAERAVEILYVSLAAYSLVVRAVRRLLDKEYAKRVSTQAAAPTPQESLKGYPTWW